MNEHLTSVLVCLSLLFGCAGVDSPFAGGTSSETDAGARPTDSGGAASAGGQGATDGGSGAPVSNAGSQGLTAGASNTAASSAGGAVDATGGASGSTSNIAGGTSGDGFTDETGYHLVWSDEFDKPGAPDPSNWVFERGFLANNEAQWYQADNAVVKDGMLVIEARKESKPNPTYVPNSTDWRTSRRTIEYTSARLNTSGRHSFLYGRFEVRARIPTAPGQWPAFWTLGVNGEWPSCGEVDIMEYYRGMVLANIGWGTGTRWQAAWNSKSAPIATLGANFSAEYHVFRMDWDEQSMKLYSDNRLTNDQSIDGARNANGVTPFRQQQFIILNLALGGDHGGDPGAASYPTLYEIDYVRVYQKN